MIFDKSQLWSDAQALTTTAASTNYLDLGVAGRAVGPGKPIPIEIEVVVSFAGGTSIDAQLKSGTDGATFGTTLRTSGAIATATLVQGYRFPLDFMPLQQTERYVQVNYVIVGTMTAGAVTAGIVGGHHTNIGTPGGPVPQFT